MITTNSRQITTQAGVSYVELLVVIVIIGIVASLAIMNRGQANEQFKRQNVARELKVAFERARFDSVKRRADGASVAFASVNVQSTQLTITTDANQNGTMDSSDSTTVSFPANISVAPRSGLSLPLTVSFNQRGEPNVSDAAFVVCNGTCSFSNDTQSTADIVYVTATGTVSMLPGGSDVANFAPPNVQVIPGGTGIRSQTQISSP
ncbi:MAG: prepilin-type N-terminal cleavage/methylation domain-containing protein [Acidobacteriota bacterium]